MIIKEKDIKDFFRSFDGGLYIRTKNRVYKIPPQEDLDKLIRSLNLKHGVEFELTPNKKIKNLRVNKYKNINPELLKEIKGE